MAYVLASGLRNGMWCRDSSGRVGIFRLRRDEDGQPFPDRAPEFHLTDDRGDTLLVIPADVHVLAQARFEDIPINRRPARAWADRHGY